MVQYVSPEQLDFTPVCRLCKGNNTLQKSHIIPAFVIKEMKATSATGYLRGGVAGNVRVQDAKTARMLCQTCETIISADEKYFASEIFRPYRGQSFQSISYDRRLIRFAVSLAWRTAVVYEKYLKIDAPSLSPQLDDALLKWEAFLLRRINSPGEHEHHLFIFSGIPESIGDAFHQKSLVYYLRAADSGPAFSSNTLWVFSNLMGSSSSLQLSQQR